MKADILVVDDDVCVRRVLTKLPAAVGYRPTAALFASFLLKPRSSTQLFAAIERALRR